MLTHGPPALQPALEGTEGAPFARFDPGTPAKSTLGALLEPLFRQFRKGSSPKFTFTILYSSSLSGREKIDKGPEHARGPWLGVFFFAPIRFPWFLCPRNPRSFWIIPDGRASLFKAVPLGVWLCGDPPRARSVVWDGTKAPSPSP